MTMKSMARTAAEKKKDAKRYEIQSSSEKYPWGLQVELGDEALKKLGIDVSELSSGSDVSLICKASITSLSSRDEGGKKRSSMSLQITHMDLRTEGSFADAFQKRVKAAGK